MDSQSWRSRFLELQTRFDEAVQEAAVATQRVEEKMATDDWPGADDWTVWRFARSQVELANAAWSEHARKAPTPRITS
ncbi:hypothetical protein [Pseudorhodoferax sp. Leaf274]|uniref:hypothetical protein n=1 Tax=Pseudorhodoferax sp. Leaf274 TaxID=1736318 RepID=UPI0007029A7E|nr:hypothetical protein [Pseudorhodoferax sp. Leaf274]KQP43949.1 hypothetical protein ASF44_28900 [Pseudorhodoferax sp. Leaf274]